MAAKYWVRRLFGPKSRTIVGRDKRPQLRLESLDARINPTNFKYGLFDTGVDAAGNVLAGGTTDPHYTLTTNPSGTGNTPVVQGNPGQYNWGANTATSAWIVPPGTTIPGTYTFHTTFTVRASGAGSNVISGLIAGDNNVTDIRVNGVSTGYTLNDVYTPTPFSVTANLVTGSNTLDFVVFDGGFPGGLRLENINAAIPTPAITAGGGAAASTTPGGAAVPVDPNVTVTYTCGPNLTRAAVRDRGLGQPGQPDGH